MPFSDLDQNEFWVQYTADSNAVLLDVRTPEEFEEGHIPGSILLDYKSPDFTMNALDLDDSKNYYVYCRSGARSKGACIVFHENGIPNSYNLLGGFSQWSGPKSV